MSSGPKEKKLKTERCGPKDSDNTLDAWMDVIERTGKRSREEREKLRTERCEYLRAYFNEPGRIQDLGEDRVIKWNDKDTWEELPEVVLNSLFAEDILKNEKVLEMLWEEIARRGAFDSYLLDMMGKG